MFMTFEKQNYLKPVTPFKERRSLATIDDYACRYKLSKVSIEEFRKMGLIQTRKFKGKTFIIDTPNLNFHNFEDVTLNDEEKIVAQPATSVATFQSFKDRIIAIGNTDVKEILALIVAAWKTVTISVVCFLALLFSISAYSSKQYDLDSLAAANVGMRAALDKAMLQLQQTAPPQIDLNSANAKIEQLQKQLTETQSQLSDTQKQLDFANQRLDFLQQRNSGALKQFDYLKSLSNR